MYNVFNCITKSTIAVILETLKKYSIHFFIPMRDDHLSMSSMRLFPGIRFMHFYSQLKYVSPRDNVFCSPIIQTQLSRQICFVLVNDFKMFMFVSTTLYEWYYNLVLLLVFFKDSYFNFFCECISFLYLRLTVKWFIFPIRYFMFFPDV